MDKMKSELMA